MSWSLSPPQGPAAWKCGIWGGDGKGVEWRVVAAGVLMASAAVGMESAVVALEPETAAGVVRTTGPECRDVAVIVAVLVAGIQVPLVACSVVAVGMGVAVVEVKPETAAGVMRITGPECRDVAVAAAVLMLVI